jgi:protein O-GlcNAc transferase
MRLLEKLLHRARDSRQSVKDAADRLIEAGNRAENAGKLLEACGLYRKAVAAAPDYAKAHLNLGIGLEAAADTDAAIRSYEAALALDPGDAYAYYNLGKLLYARGDPRSAKGMLLAALDRKAEFPEAQVALSNVYDLLGDTSAAAAALDSALKQRPDYAGAWYNYGVILRKLRDFPGAESALRRAISIDPGLFHAHQVLGEVLRGQSRIGEALDAFRVARGLVPDQFDVESAELFTLNFSEDISSEALFARHREFGARLERACRPRFGPFRRGDAEKRLRIGYLSGDFWRHPVALFMIPVLERHDRAAYEAYCYSTGMISDEVTLQLKSLADAWRDAASLSDDELADAINRDNIDILVDLSGHSGVFRLAVFARQPAPIQAAWLGYLNTTGLTRIRYRICDSHTDPPGLTEHLHTETLVRLPNSQWCYRPFIPDIRPGALPLKRNGFVTFGSFNHVSKLSPSIRKLWAEILARLPDSRLMLVGVPHGGAGDSLLSDLQQAGAARSRITVVPHAALDEYLRTFGAVDIALDTTPYSGATTTCDALWMGVPVLSLRGSRSISRSSTSILSAVGLSQWIASTPEEYVRLAVEFARNEPLLADLRASLRKKVLDSPIMDEAGFVRDLETAFRGMWRAWCIAAPQ